MTFLGCVTVIMIVCHFLFLFSWNMICIYVGSCLFCFKKYFWITPLGIFYFLKSWFWAGGTRKLWSLFYLSYLLSVIFKNSLHSHFTSLCFPILSPVPILVVSVYYLLGSFQCDLPFCDDYVFLLLHECCYSFYCLFKFHQNFCILVLRSHFTMTVES